MKWLPILLLLTSCASVPRAAIIAGGASSAYMYDRCCTQMDEQPFRTLVGEHPNDLNFVLVTVGGILLFNKVDEALEDHPAAQTIWRAGTTMFGFGAMLYAIPRAKR